MKHIYNLSSAASNLRLAALALGTALSGKVLALLFICFFLLMSGESMGQTITLYGPNGFANNTGLTFSDNFTGSEGTIGVTGGELKVESTTGKGYYRTAVINQSYNLIDGYIYTVSFKARAVGAVGSVAVIIGASIVDAGNPVGKQELNSVTVPISSTMNNYTLTFRSNVSGAANLALKLFLGNGNNKDAILIDDLILTQTCAANAPQVTSAGTCANSANLRLRASSTPGGGTYRWYTVPENGTASSQTGSEFVTPVLTQTTTYYVSYVNSAGCESERVPVMANISQIVKPTVTSDAQCVNGSLTITFTARGAADDETYIWYNNDNVEQARGTTISRSTNTQGDPGVYYAVIVKIGDEGCRSDKEYLVMPDNNPTPTTPPSINRTVCIGASVTLEPTVELGMTYVWYNASEVEQARGMTYTIPNALSGNTTYYYRKLNTATGCISQRATIEITADQPALAFSRIEGLAAVCQGPSSVTYRVPSGANYYDWSITPNTGSSGATFTGQGTNTITINYPSTQYVGKISVIVRNDCSEYTTSLDVQTTNINSLTGNIIQPDNLELDKRARFKFETNVPDGEIVAVQWYQRTLPSNTWSRVQSIDGRDLEFEKMPGNINGLKVDIQVKPTTAGAYCFVPFSSTETYGVPSFEINNLGITPLPVELISFKAQRHSNGVSLTWATASELDNRGFEVQVSSNGRNFETIGFVESKVGTTSIRQDYNFLDTKAVSGTRYYRLKQIDFNGKFEYSPIKAVSLDERNGAVVAYPNPFEDVLTVSLNGSKARQVQVILVDAMGKVLLQQMEETAGNSISVDMASVTAKGMYMLHVLDDNAKHTFKLMKR